MKKKISLNQKLSLKKETVGTLLPKQESAAWMAAVKGGRLTTIGRTCFPNTADPACVPVTTTPICL
ncbi:class I lanthipeptide [Chitinophaga solisilvae]|uniref:Uncharacterized protein n=1 Tax=Chitinophaga solisilvae TaxID=1233460 RepID=A0A3S1D1I8_9BACT|nr:class I lanthipeptide [Chitinophaga solisilvae]NSL87251.1 hypothetical protein [Chitinophaga solisilvae]